MDTPTITLETPVQKPTTNDEVDGRTIIRSEMENEMQLSGGATSSAVHGIESPRSELERKVECGGRFIPSSDIEAGNKKLISPTEFKFFPKLPKEVQLKIWNFYTFPRIFMLDRFGSFWTKYYTPPAAQACRDARIEVMKRYSLIRSDTYMTIPESSIWIDPEVDTILLWNTVWKQPGSLQLAFDQLRCFDSCKEIERKIRRTPASALGTTSMRNNLDGKYHVAIPNLYFKGLNERHTFNRFLQDRIFASLTFVWNIEDDIDLGSNDAELVEEGDDNVCHKDLIQSSREKVEKDIVQQLPGSTPVPVFKMARIQERNPRHDVQRFKTFGPEREGSGLDGSA